MKKIKYSIISGFVATVVLSLLMIMKAKMGLMPDLNAIKMMSGMAHKMLGLPNMMAIGWMMHFVIGTVLWGYLYSVIHNAFTGSSVIKGLVLGVVAWLLMMVMVMPMAEAGLFGLSLGMMAPVMTLMLHMVYGAVIGFVFDKVSCKECSS